MHHARTALAALCLGTLWAAAAQAATCLRGQQVVLADGLVATVVEARGRMICIVRDSWTGEEVVTLPTELVPVPRDDENAWPFFDDYDCIRYGWDEVLYTLTLKEDGSWVRSDQPGEMGNWRAENFDTLTLYGSTLPFVQVVQQSDGVTFVDPDGEWVMTCPRR